MRKREQRVAEAEAARQQVTNILERISDPFVALDANWRYTYVNEKAAQIFGRKREDLAGKQIWTEFPEKIEQPIGKACYKALETQQPVYLDEYYPPCDRWFENRIYPSQDGLSIFFQDITAHKKTENELRKKNRDFTALNACNQALVRVTDELELLNAICRICVEIGGYRLAWVGYAEQDEGQNVRPVAQHGFEAGYLDTIHITWADVECGRGPTGAAIRTGKPCLARNIPNDPNFAIWRAAAIQRGYASSIALPLILLPLSSPGRGVEGEGGVLGALNIYAAEPDAFDADEVSLLTELASDLAYGIGSLRTRAERKRAEEALRESEGRFKAIAANTPDHILVQDNELRYLFVVNPQLGLTEQDMIGKTDHVFLSKEEADKLTEIKTQVLKTGKPVHLETSLLSLAGAAEFFDGTYVPRFDALGQIDGLIGYFRNVTERKRAEKEIAWLASFPAQNPNPVVEVDSSGTVRYMNPAAQRMFPELPVKRFKHPWLAGLEPVIAKFKSEGAGSLRRELKIGDSWYAQPLYYVPEGERLRVYGNDITERKQAEDKLRLSEERFSHAFHVGPAGMTITRIADGKFIDANESFCRMFEFNREEVLDHTSTELKMWTPEERQKLIRQQLESGGLHDFDLQARSKSGRTIDILLSSKPITLKGEACHITTLIDVTKRKLAEKALAASEAKYRAFFENSIDAILLTSPDGNIYAANPAACQMFGRSESEICQSGRARLVDLADPQLSILLAERTSTGKARGELTMLRQDGTRFPVELSTVLFHDHENTTRTSMIIRDITARKQTEEKLENQARLLELSHDAILVWELDGGITFWNQGAARMYGFLEAEAVGQVSRKLLQTRHPQGYERFRSELASEGSWSGELTQITHNGQKITVETQQQVVYFPDGQAMVLETNRDITVRKQAEAEICRLNMELEQRVRERTAQLQAANKSLESFSYSVSHDLRAPLRAVSGFAAIIARRHRVDLNDEGRHYVDNIVQASERMGHLIDDLLTYSRLGRIGVRREPVSLQEVCAALASDFAGRLTETRGTLDIAADLPTVMGDQTLLRQILTNLLENAITYHKSEVPAQVTVACQTEGAEVIIRVKDNGIGIPAEYHEKIFNVFQRLHSEDDYPGTGIGLAAVKKSVELLGGSVWVESVVGEGSTFFVKLPFVSGQ